LFYALLEIGTGIIGPLKAMVSEDGAFVVVLFKDDDCFPTEVIIQATFA